MSRTTQKQRERVHLESFLQESGLLKGTPTTAIRDHERPDFLVSQPGGVLGIEVTEFTESRELSKGSIPLAIERVEEQIIRRAARLYRPSSDLLLHVDVVFKIKPTRSPITDDLKAARDSKWQDALARSIVDIVGANLPTHAKTVPIIYPHVNWQMLPPEIAAVFITHAPYLEENLWTVGRSFVRNQLRREDIEAELGRKEASVADYRRHCSELWLVLVAHGFSPARDAELSVTVEPNSCRTGFDRAFFFNFFDKHLLEIGLHSEDV